MTTHSPRRTQRRARCAHPCRARGALGGLCGVALTLLIGLVPARAHAGGIELVGAGARSLGRGGASMARGDDPLNVRLNPAALADLQGGHLVAGLNLSLFDACFDAYGYYGWGLYQGSSRDTPERAQREGRELTQLVLTDPDDGTQQLSTPGRDPGYYADPLDEVCLDQSYVPIPQLVYGARLSDHIGFALGLAYPNAQPSGRWGSSLGVIRSDSGELRPASTRYMLISSGNRAFFPTAGLGAQLFPALRLGASFTWGIYAIDTQTMSSSGGGTDPLNHVLSRVEAVDYFVPIAAVSVQLVPIDALDFALALRTHDDIDAAGKMSATTGLFRTDFLPHTGPPLELKSVRQRMPWMVSGGIRYASRFEGRTYDRIAARDPRHRPRDAMLDERFDIELDAEFQKSSRNDEQVLTYVPSAVEFKPATTAAVVPVAFPPGGVTQIRIPKHWRDQWSVRLGSTYNVLPGLLSLSAGAHYETRGIDPAFAQIDFWPMQRVGLHAGVTIRLFGRHDLVLAYARVFQETLIVKSPAHGDRLAGGFDKSVEPLDARGQVLAPLEDPSEPARGDGTAARLQVLTQTSASDPAYVINAGAFRSSFDLLALTLHLHF